MTRMPRDTRTDSTLAFLRCPYHFISQQSQHLTSDIFRTRLALQETICMVGQEAAELFYDANRFMRQGAMPGVIVNTLLGQGGVQGLDDEVHRHRK